MILAFKALSQATIVLRLSFLWSFQQK